MMNKLISHLDGMIWFYFLRSNVLCCIFWRLYYVRAYSLPWLGGDGTGLPTNTYLWPGYEALHRKCNGLKEIGGEFKYMGPWGLPALNTAILLTSGLTITWAHHALKESNRYQLIIGLALTVLLGTFMYFQGVEYGHAFKDLNLNLQADIWFYFFLCSLAFMDFACNCWNFNVMCNIR